MIADLAIEAATVRREIGELSEGIWVTKTSRKKTFILQRDKTSPNNRTREESSIGYFKTLMMMSTIRKLGIYIISFNIYRLLPKAPQLFFEE